MLFPKPIKKTTPKREKWGTLAQYKIICAEIFEERAGKCEECGVHIAEAKYHNFNHTDGRTKNFLNKNTIQLLCFPCHSQYHGIEEKSNFLV